MSKKELLDQPMLPPPPGVKSNFERPVTRIPSYNAIIIIPLILASLFVVLRIYTRAWISKSLGWDDYTSVISLVLDVPFCIGLTLAPLYGAGYHAWDVQLKKYTPLVKASTQFVLSRRLQHIFNRTPVEKGPILMRERRML